MKNNFYKILSAVCAVALVWNTFTIIGLKNDVIILQNALGNSQRTLESRINDIYRNVDKQLKEQLDILEVSEFKLISADVDSLTAVVHFVAKPKEYSKNTVASVKLNGVLTDMKPAEEGFELTREVPLMKDSRIEQIILEENGNIRQQTLDEIISPRREFIATVYADMSASGTYSHDTGIWNLDTEIQINLEQKGKIVDIVKVELVQVTNDVEVMRKQLEATDKYAENRHGAETIEAERVKEFEESNWYYDDFLHSSKMEFKLSKNSTTYLYADVTDSEGFLHRCLIEGWKVNADGSLGDEAAPWFRGREAMEVYSPDGELIFELEENLIEWH